MAAVHTLAADMLFRDAVYLSWKINRVLGLGLVPVLAVVADMEAAAADMEVNIVPPTPARFQCWSRWTIIGRIPRVTKRRRFWKHEGL
jgi:hypothetical protein